MANHPSAEKRHRQSVKRAARNQAVRSHVRTEVKKLRSLVTASDADKAQGGAAGGRVDPRQGGRQGRAAQEQRRPPHLASRQADRQARLRPARRRPLSARRGPGAAPAASTRGGREPRCRRSSPRRRPPRACAARAPARAAGSSGARHDEEAATAAEGALGAILVHARNRAAHARAAARAAPTPSARPAARDARPTRAPSQAAIGVRDAPLAQRALERERGQAALAADRVEHLLDTHLVACRSAATASRARAPAAAARCRRDRRGSPPPSPPAAAPARAAIRSTSAITARRVPATSRAVPTSRRCTQSRFASAANSVLRMSGSVASSTRCDTGGDLVEDRGQRALHLVAQPLGPAQHHQTRAGRRDHLDRGDDRLEIGLVSLQQIVGAEAGSWRRPSWPGSRRGGGRPAGCRRRRTAAATRPSRCVALPRLCRRAARGGASRAAGLRSLPPSRCRDRARSSRARDRAPRPAATRTAGRRTAAPGRSGSDPSC